MEEQPNKPYTLSRLEHFSDVKVGDVLMSYDSFRNKPLVARVTEVRDSSIGYAYSYGSGILRLGSLDEVAFFRPSQGKILAGTIMYQVLTGLRDAAAPYTGFQEPHKGTA